MNENETIRKNTGTIIRELCSERNITIQELERKCNLGNGSVKRWELGSSPTLKAMITISDFFDVSIDYLAGSTPEKAKLEEWNRKFNVERLALEARMFDSFGKLKKIFSEIELIDLDDTDLELLKAYLELLVKRKK